MGVCSLKRKLFLALLLGALAGWLDVGVSHAHTGEIHIGGLSTAASLAIIVAGVVVAALFIGIFLLRWRQSVQSSQSSTAQSKEGDEDTVPEFESQDRG